MAGFRRDKPIDPMHERGICLWLAEHHERRAAETEGWDHDDHTKAAKACRERAEEWEAKAAAQETPPAFLRRQCQPEAPIRKPISAVPTTRTPAPVKPAPRQKAAATTQLNLF